MPFQLVAYDKLKISVQESIKELVKYHKGDINKLDESIEKNLPTDRRIQVQMLQKTISHLDTIDKPEHTPADKAKWMEFKAKTLNALVIYIRDRIQKSYDKAYVGKPDNSTFFKSLGTALEISTDNSLSSDDFVELYNHLEKYILTQTYVEHKPSKGYLPSDKQLFSSIKDYEVSDDLKELIKEQTKMRCDSFDSAKIKHEKQLSASTPKSSSWFSLGKSKQSGETTPAATPSGGI